MLSRCAPGEGFSGVFSDWIMTASLGCLLPTCLRPDAWAILGNFLRTDTYLSFRGLGLKGLGI